jgi:hypothetical protein
LFRPGGGASLWSVKFGSSSRLAFLAPLLAAALVFSLANPACTTSCSDEETGGPEEIRGGTTDSTRSVYESTSFSGKYLKFRPNKRYKFFHGLRGTPAVVQAWVGFHEVPLNSDMETGNISEAAGNEAILEAVTSEYVTIRNDTCETFYLRLVASDPIESGAAGAGN